MTSLKAALQAIKMGNTTSAADGKAKDTTHAKALRKGSASPSPPSTPALKSARPIAPTSTAPPGHAATATAGQPPASVRPAAAAEPLPISYARPRNGVRDQIVRCHVLDYLPGSNSQPTEPEETLV